jgi:threonine synthase
LHKGFKDLLSLGWIEKIPRIFGIQARGSAAIYNAFAAGIERIEAVQADTLADSISVDLPRDGIRALRAATETEGAYLAVSDRSILAAMKHLSVLAGVFAEPAGAAAHAGLRKAVEAELISADDTVVLLNTGNGIKDVASAMEAAGEATVIDPDLDSLARAVEEKGN